MVASVMTAAPGEFLEGRLDADLVAKLRQCGQQPRNSRTPLRTPVVRIIVLFVVLIAAVSLAKPV